MQGGYPPATPEKPSPLGLVALLMSIAGCVVFPLLAAALGLAFNRSDAGFVSVLIALGLGAVVVVMAAILAIVALARGRGHRTSAIIALVLGVVSIPVGAFAGFWGILFAAGGGAHGRPFRAGQHAYRTPTARGDAWSAGGPVPETSGLDPALRRALAEGWTVDASLEHASIAAFSTLALDLLALGAPPSLVARAHRAAMDEVAHAGDCFALASAYAGEALSAAAFPAVLAARPSENDDTRLRRLAVETAVDGCVGEATAAAIARDMEKVAVDPIVATVLGRIARDEQEHAALAWDVLLWCIERGDPGVLATVRDALGTSEAEPLLDGVERDLSCHGRASAASWSATRARVRSAVRARLDAGRVMVAARPRDLHA
jgi:hypothetical protein